jgi:signal transduction histidine kinase
MMQGLGPSAGAARAGGSFTVRRLPIRRKLTVALAVPLTALVILTALEVLRTSREVDDVAEQTELAKSAIGPSGIITALQWERSWLSTYLIGQEDAVNVPIEGTEESRANTDEVVARFREELTHRSPLVVDAFQEAMDGLDRLTELRQQVDENVDTTPRDLENIQFSDSVFTAYSEMIAPFFTATTRVALVVDDPDLRQGAELADTISRQTETMSLLLNYTISTAMSPSGIDQSAEITRVATLHSDFKDANDRLRRASGPYRFLARNHFPEAFAGRVDEQIDQALSTGTLDLTTVLAAVNVPDDEGYLPYQNTLHSTITERADELKSNAENRRVWFIFIAVIALAAAVALTLLVSWSITRPLRRLTGEAKEMAERRLPDAVLDILDTPLGDDVQVPHVAPVSVRTRDEVADVAVALNTVQDSALELAVEQAVLRRNIADSFVNLGRRNQNLLGRQLDFITELESNETGPDTLASLFRLDHLATRMRRNAESLLVLAGVEPPRKWAAPVRVTDVIRAALGEVEDYQRVTVRGVEPATVLGSVAADLAHLIAELLENALTFSPPEEKVEVRGRHRADGQYELAVVDRGFGMPDADIVNGNRRLSGTESFTIAPSKYLGHYVAGNLAARHGIRIQLGKTPGHGITASVELPPTLLTTEAPTGDPITDPHGTRTVGSRARSEVGAGMAGAGTDAAGALPGAVGAPPEPARARAEDVVAADASPAATAWAPETPATPSLPPLPPPPPSPADAPGAPGAPDQSGALPGPSPVAPPPWAAKPPAAPPPPDALTDEPRRTASGLVKRSPLPREEEDESPAASALSGDLLAALSDHTRRLGEGRGSGSAFGAAPGGSPFGTSHTPGSPSRGPSPSPSPSPSPFGSASAPGSSASSGQSPVWAFLDSALARPAAAPQPLRGRTSPPPGPRPDPNSGGTTSSGLVRRVRGAQLPTTQPLSLRRRGGPADQPSASQPPPAAPLPSRAVPPVPPAPQMAPRAARQPGAPGAPAEDVYSFLSSFNAGVQRGLDEARRPNRGPGGA